MVSMPGAPNRLKWDADGPEVEEFRSKAYSLPQGADYDRWYSWGYIRGRTGDKLLKRYLTNDGYREGYEDGKSDMM
jgi:hypothetical protein